jgi:lipoprotein-anchoring transpeptidase ErfK/SrfK
VSKPPVTLVTFVVGLVVLLVVLYAYDRSRADMVAEGVRVAGVSVGGQSAEEARATIERRVAAPLEKPLRVAAPGRDHVLTAKRARLRTDVGRMAADAVAASRDGFFVVRAVRDLTGSGEDADLPARISYSRRSVSRLVERVERSVNRPPRDASVAMSGGGLERVRAQNGRRLETEDLLRRVRRRVARPGPRVVRARAEIQRPKVLTSQLEEKYPHVVTIDRGGYTLRYYRRLELKKSYTIAVGQAGLETPAGQYQIQNKAVNPAWHVPNSAWAGEKAGQVIPGGTAENPLKARWMGIADGAGIHGTDQLGSLGTSASHGCIRMAIPEVIELYEKVPVKTPVYIG